MHYKMHNIMHHKMEHFAFSKQNSLSLANDMDIGVISNHNFSFHGVLYWIKMYSSDYSLQSLKKVRKLIVKKVNHKQIEYKMFN